MDLTAEFAQPARAMDRVFGTHTMQGPILATGILLYVAEGLPELMVKDQRTWRRWLGRNHARTDGVWLVLAKKSTTEPTSLTYDQALAEALCYGWIDGQLRTRDNGTYRQRFTPRRQRSGWSKRNVQLVEKLIAEKRMTPAGLAAVERAKGDGSWERAYAGAASIEVPEDLASALAANRKAAAKFKRLSSQNRYAILYRVQTAKRAETRARRIAEFVAMLARGEAIYPERNT
jgi:uncharacterized protein YdeI (YjbR/CyaY-like superfamily)